MMPMTTDTHTAEVAVRHSVEAKTTLIVADITSLTITDRSTYGDADLLLGRIRQAKRQATEIFEEKLGAILKRTYDTLQDLYALRKELTETPFANAESSVKGKMAVWQAADRARIERERQAALVEENRLRAIADKQRREADELARTARTAAARQEVERRQEAARQSLERAAEATQAAVAAEKAKPVTGSFSRTVSKKVPQVTDLGAFIDAVYAGTIPVILLQVNAEVLAEYWKSDRGIVSSWPGVEIVDQTSVGGR